MQRSSSPAPTRVDWATFNAQLADYVHLELAGQAAEEIYPEIAFYITRFSECEAAYDREFRSQGLRKSVPELQQLGERAAVANVMQRIVTAPVAASAPAPQPDWVEIVLNEGRAWLERGTQRWRQLWLALPVLSGGPAHTPALAGLMSTATTASPLRGVSNIAPANANFELKLAILSDSAVGNDTLCQVEVVITLHDRFGDFSGVQITLLWGAVTQQQITDALGKVTFTSLPCDQLSTMNLLVTLPDSL